VIRSVWPRFGLSCNMVFVFYFGQNLGSKRARYMVNFIILNSLLARKLIYVKICVCYVSNLKDNRGVPWLARDWKQGKRKKKKQNRPDLGQLAWWAWGFVWPSRKKNKIYKKGPFGLLVGFKAQ
jgi:hypothetical protein